MILDIFFIFLLRLADQKNNHHKDKTIINIVIKDPKEDKMDELDGVPPPPPMSVEVSVVSLAMNSLHLVVVAVSVSFL